MGFRLVPKSGTLNDLERRNDRYLAYHIWTDAAMMELCSPHMWCSWTNPSDE